MKYAISLGFFAVLAGLGFGIFYLAFYVLCPFIISLIPVTAWSGLINIGVYAVVGYFGGVGIPSGLILWGLMFGFISFSRD